MKKFLWFVFLLVVRTGFSQQYNHNSVEKSHSKAAGCIPASSSIYMELNNVKALIHTGGNLWQIRSQNRSHYEIPKNSGIMALFASALWLGGVDVNGQLKLAALRYRSGNDYWTGPLANNTAVISTEECIKYDRFFHTTQDEIREFDSWYNAGIADAQNGTNIQATEFPNYVVPDIIKQWPAHGDVSQGQDYYLAPFYDRNEDNVYNYEDGDYPWYDFNKDIDCQTDRTVSLYGDENNWWVMNDRGNIHTETGADPIGMEVRSQAFAFATNDEVNNMTFYNYELINRSTQTLTNTYFGIFIDVALGGAFDDYVGCDVSRGLGYSYNGRDFDASEQGFNGYGDQPPAVGVDFFEGPYQDNDGIDNAVGIGPGEAVKGNGIGYGDGIVDNERFGMRRFLYYNNVGSGNINQTDPQIATDYYNYLRGYWKDGTRFVYGGSGHISDEQANPNVECDFMFPGDSDSLAWGTGGIPQDPWTEESAGNPPYDRRFVQSAGPFELEPGAVNNITVGVVWARATSGGPFESVRALQKADDKAQALFENCFKVLEGPHAPEMHIQELENELVFSLSNPLGSNNFNESYQEEDPFIIVDPNSDQDNIYRFQGYQVFQTVSDEVSISDLDNIELARLVFQCDIEDNIANLVNYETDKSTGVLVGNLKVVANNEGIRHSFSVKEDLFAQGDPKLINHKTYHYIAISYAANTYGNFNPIDASTFDGQRKPYLASRKASIGAVNVQSAIPHKPVVENGGTVFSMNFGDYLPLTKVDGSGNGDNWLEITEQSESSILQEGYVDTVNYTINGGPIQVKVIDPLSLEPADFELKFLPDNANECDSSNWILVNKTSNDTVYSNQTIELLNEQLIPEWGISIMISHDPLVCRNEASNCAYKDQDIWPLGSQITFADSSNRWLIPLPDAEGENILNWILAGSYDPQGDNPTQFEFLHPQYYKDIYDENQLYESEISAGFAPSYLIQKYADHPISPYGRNSNIVAVMNTKPTLAHLNNVDIVITKDKSKWTRCPVLEMGRNSDWNEGNAEKMMLRRAKSIDKNGRKSGEPGYNSNEGALISDSSMGWFPGYAIDLDRGERLQIVFGEDSRRVANNGRDMLWNPGSEIGNNGSFINGGMQPIYLLSSHDDLGTSYPLNDDGNWLYNKLKNNNVADYLDVFNRVNWVGFFLKDPEREQLSSDVRIKLRIKKPFENLVRTNENSGYPMYRFSTKSYGTYTDNTEALSSVLQEINVVPNPYYGYSQYERNKLDNKVKIVNLPEKCEISIYNIRGKLVRRYSKDNAATYQDWDLKNGKGIPIASGMHLIHVKVDGVGERILKSFIGMREVDLENF